MTETEIKVLAIVEEEFVKLSEIYIAKPELYEGDADIMIAQYASYIAFITLYTSETFDQTIDRLIS